MTDHLNITVGLVLHIATAVATAIIAKRKHRRALLWGVVGLIGGLIILLALHCFFENAALLDHEQQRVSRTKENNLFAVVGIIAVIVLMAGLIGL